MKTILIVIIAALIVLGGMAVDEIHIRQEFNALQAENQELRQKVEAYEQKLSEVSLRLHDYEIKEASWNQEKERLDAEIAALRAQKPELTINKTGCTPTAPSPVTNSILGLGVVGVIGSSSVLIGHINKTRRLRRSPSFRQNSDNQQHTHVRVLTGRNKT